MEPLEMLEELCEKFGPNLTTAKLGVDDHDVWRWRTGYLRISQLDANGIRYLHDLEFNPATRTDR